MAKTSITLTHGRAGDYLGRASMKARDALARFEDLLVGCANGAYQGATGFEVASAQASGTATFSGTHGVSATGTVELTDVMGEYAVGTVTLGGGAGNVTIVIGGTSIGPVAFNTSDAQTATDCITAINANGTVAALVTATSGGSGVIVIDADAAGTAGNAITLTASRTAGTATASGATLAGGAQGSVTVTVDGTAVVTNTTNLTDTASATAVAAALEADSTLGPLLSAVGNAAVVEITWTEPGTDGNVTLAASSATGSATASDATLSGGTDDVGTVSISGVDVAVDVTGMTNTAAATAMAAAINAESTALVADNVTATSSGAVVTITAVQPGTTGNSITLAVSGGGLSRSGARLTGGTATSYTF